MKLQRDNISQNLPKKYLTLILAQNLLFYFEKFFNV